MRIYNECVSRFRLVSFQGLSRWEAGRLDPRCWSCLSCISAQLREHFLACKLSSCSPNLCVCGYGCGCGAMLIQLLYSRALSQITPIPSSMLRASVGLPWEGRPHMPCSLCHSCSGLCSPGLLTNTTLYIFYFSETKTFSSSLLGFLSSLLSPLLLFQGDFSSGRRLTLLPVHYSEPGSPDSLPSPTSAASRSTLSLPPCATGAPHPCVPSWSPPAP